MRHDKVHTVGESYNMMKKKEEEKSRPRIMSMKVLEDRASAGAQILPNLNL